LEYWLPLRKLVCPLENWLPVEELNFPFGILVAS
jgi:hypothetical protein